MTKPYDPNGPIAVLVVSNDSTEDIRSGITDVLAIDEKIIIVGVTDNAAEAMKLTGRRQPHVIIVNDTLKDMDGISFIKDVSRRYPAAMCLMISERDEPSFLRESMLAGARNFIKKPVSSKELIQLVRIFYRSLNPRLC
jgi:pilus assembly protein CpaE